VTTFWARWGDITVSAEMVLLEAKLGPGRDLIETIARRKCAAAMAWERGVPVSERDVEAALGRFYAARGLETLEHIRDWRTAEHLKEDAIRSYLREQLLIERLSELLAPDVAVEERYRAQRDELRLARVERFVFSSETAAADFITAVQNDEIEPRLGERLSFERSRYPTEIADALGRADEGALLGPVAVGRKAWEVYRLIGWESPPLNAALREQIREEIFREAVAPSGATDALKFLL
jgi:hypothetical protein